LPRQLPIPFRFGRRDGAVARKAIYGILVRCHDRLQKPHRIVVLDSNDHARQPGWHYQFRRYIVAQNLATKILEAHLVEGRLMPGEEISIKIDHTLLQDATGTMVMLEFMAMGTPREPAR
jgi:hypothetical protein